ncbi:endonuclease/exonuclease/phosphatase family protein [Catenuloplanes indicus]|uniref:Endonuclease/exonuclease/phosphatase (EEP) superfamily protein YafD n=1 Tax=Catenuloplanes indicus TaxID=137267 RepID=A0AAE3W757_9ACTN|nr:endonuclease/exonuclease/phosphatase family protein [Catenuloplanes indicus]MDQ0370527.1 endonuclease/exonuclease/phosphatase (EEP) superfamily protein YafD [Catenuloplanes indicus]
MRKRTTLLGAAVAGLIGLLGATMVTLGGGSTATAAEAATVPIKVITWNICGEYTGCPKISTAAEVNGKRNAIRDLINTHQADAILLNETCEWHANSVVQLLNQAAGRQLWTMSFAVVRQLDDGSGGTGYTAWPGKRTRTCGSAGVKAVVTPTTTPHALGMAILTKGPHDETTTYDLPSSTTLWSGTHQLLCVRKTAAETTTGGPVRICASHFTPSNVTNPDQLRVDQANRVATLISSFGDERIVFGGDLNSYPPKSYRTSPVQSATTLQPIYDLMRECEERFTDDTGRDTARWTGGSGKLDYLFARSGGDNPESLTGDCVTGPVTEAAQPNSDHAPVIGAFNL